MHRQGQKAVQNPEELCAQAFLLLRAMHQLLPLATHQLLRAAYRLLGGGGWGGSQHLKQVVVAPPGKVEFCPDQHNQTIHLG